MALIKLNNQSLTAVSALPAGLDTGKVLQVVSTTKRDAFTASGSSETFITDITGLSATITPSSTANKVLVLVQCAIVANNSGVGIRILRGTTDIASGDTAGSRRTYTMAGMYTPSSPTQYGTASNHINYLDSPSSTSALTYKVQGGCQNGTIYVNQQLYDLDNVNGTRFVSTITLMEIAG